MTEPPAWYEFRAERIHQALLDAAGGLRDLDELGEEVIDQVTDGSESVVLFSEHEANLFAGVIASGKFTGFDPRHGVEHGEALKHLAKHHECVQVIERLTGQRNDVLAALWDARNYAYNDIYEGEYGDLYLTAEHLLDALRPTLPGKRIYREATLNAEQCDECHDTWGHEDDCSVGQQQKTLYGRRAHAIASHTSCLTMGEALIAHIKRCLERVEEVALNVRELTTEVYSDHVVTPSDVLPVLKLEDLNVNLDPSNPATLAVHIYPPLEDLPYCGSEGYGFDHSEPHRACRFLVS